MKYELTFEYYHDLNGDMTNISRVKIIEPDLPYELTALTALARVMYHLHKTDAGSDRGESLYSKITGSRENLTVWIRKIRLQMRELMLDSYCLYSCKAEDNDSARQCWEGGGHGCMITRFRDSRNYREVLIRHILRENKDFAKSSANINHLISEPYRYQFILKNTAKITSPDDSDIKENIVYENKNERQKEKLKEVVQNLIGEEPDYKRAWVTLMAMEGETFKAVVDILKILAAYNIACDCQRFGAESFKMMYIDIFIFLRDRDCKTIEKEITSYIKHDLFRYLELLYKLKISNSSKLESQLRNDKELNSVLGKDRDYFVEIFCDAVKNLLKRY